MDNLFLQMYSQTKTNEEKFSHWALLLEDDEEAYIYHISKKKNRVFL